MLRRRCVLALLGVLCLPALASAEPLADTKPLTTEGDLAEKMVAGIDKYLRRELDASAEKSLKFWDTVKEPTVEAYLKAVQPKRERLKKILGVVDERVPFTDLEYVGGPRTPSLVAETKTYTVHAVRWPVLPGVEGEGLLLEPKEKVVACVVAVPDPDWTPEMIVGLAPGVPQESQFARHLAANGCRVLVPTLIDRKDDYSGNPKLGRMTNQPHREFIYRMAYEMGRHIIGYEIQKVLAAVDWFTREKNHPPVGIVGYGEGARLAYYSAQIDQRIQGVACGGWRRFFPTKVIWMEPIYENVWGLLPDFDNTNATTTSALIGPRTLYSDENSGPEISGPPPARTGRTGAAPGRFPGSETLWLLGSAPFESFKQRISSSTDNRAGHPACLPDLLTELTRPKEGRWQFRSETVVPEDKRKDFDPAARQKRQFDQLVNFTQKLMRDSEQHRADTFWSKLDTSSVEKYKASTEPFRKQLWEEVIGKLPAPTEPINPRTRESYDTQKWKGYEVTLDLYPDVYAYGILLVPKDLKPGEKRPVVVCQHGLEGRPQDVVNPTKRTNYYNSFGAQLADRGYIVYAPQNPYIGHDKFRVLQRMANPLGVSLFSFIIRQHERTLDWLATLPFVDPERMAFYGLSYGGKTAMRVPAVLPRYCLSICSGDFNEWTWKNVSVDFRGSYMFSPEYEMPEFNLGQTLVYAEMAALIAPRPFMVERGHDDGVGIDEWVAYEYAKVRRLYSRLKLPERTEIEFFAGGHEIHGQGTFAFLDKHLKWPK
jgi:dienelactone hydrolase